MVQELRNFEASKDTAASEGSPAAAWSGAVWRTLDAALFDRGWSQRALSATSGISESTISSWKSHLPSERSLDRVVRALNTDTVATPVDLQELRSLRHRTALRAGHVAAQLASSPSDYRRAAGLFTTAHMLSDGLKIRDDGLLAFEYATEASRLAGVDQEALSEECADALGTTFADPELPVERSRSAWSPGATTRGCSTSALGASTPA